MGGDGLPGRTDVVEFAFDGQQRGLADGGKIDALSLPGERSQRQAVAQEDLIDRLEEIFGGDIHDGQIFVVKLLPRGGCFAVAAHEFVVHVDVRVDMPVRVHRDERRELHVAGIDLPSRARIVGRHRRDEVLFEPLERVLCGQQRRRGGMKPRVDRAAHQRHRARLGGIAVRRHQRDRRENGRGGLADRNDVDVGTQTPKIGQRIADVRVEVEGSGGKRHVARVGPIGHVHVVVGDERLDGAAHEGGVMPGHRRGQQDARNFVAAVARETDQPAEGLFVDHVHASVDVPIRLAAPFRGPGEDLGRGGDHPAGQGVGHRVERATEAGLRRRRRPAPRRHAEICRVVEPVAVIDGVPRRRKMRQSLAAKGYFSL